MSLRGSLGNDKEGADTSWKNDTKIERGLMVMVGEGKRCRRFHCQTWPRKDYFKIDHTGSSMLEGPRLMFPHL